MTLASQIGARLRQLRQAAQLSQAELAARAGLSTSMVSMTERGERLPTLETLAGVLRARHRAVNGVEAPVTRLLANFFEDLVDAELLKP